MCYIWGPSCWYIRSLRLCYQTNVGFHDTNQNAFWVAFVVRYYFFAFTKYEVKENGMLWWRCARCSSRYEPCTLNQHRSSFDVSNGVAFCLRLAQRMWREAGLNCWVLGVCGSTMFLVRCYNSIKSRLTVELWSLSDSKFVDCIVETCDCVACAESM